MKVQIYTLQSVDEAKKVASLGVDLVGVTPANIGLPGEITLEMGKDICASLTGTTTVAISVSNNISEIIDMAKPKIGTNCLIANDAVIENGTIIGDNVIINGGAPQSGEPMDTIQLFITLLSGPVFYTYFWIVNDGQTLGMQAWKIKLISTQILHLLLQKHLTVNYLYLQQP